MDRFFRMVELKVSDLLVFLSMESVLIYGIISDLIVAAERYKER